MSNPDPLSPAPGSPPVTWRFVLTVQAQSARQAWHAHLRSEDGARLDFDTPIELLRHLAQLGADTPPPGRLK